MGHIGLNQEQSGLRAGEFEVKIAGADLDFHAASIADPLPTGRQIALLSGIGDPNDLIVLQQLPNRELEELRIDETTDLRVRGVEHFIVAQSDRTYRFVVDGLKLEWPFSDPSALVIKKLVNKVEDHELVQERDEQPDQVIPDHEHVQLGGRGTERFRLKKIVRHVKVKYNHTEFTLEARDYTTEELLTAFSVPTGYVLDLIAPNGDFIELKPGSTIRIVACMEFVSHAPCGGAS